MEYVYAAMLLHSAEKTIDDDAVSAVLKAAGVDVDAARVKALVASLSGVDTVSYTHLTLPTTPYV